MNQHETTELDGGPYDYIIIGAGSAGAALAYRLSENPSNRVLLIEAGKAGHPLERLPISFALFIDHPGVNWRYRSEPEEGTHNRAIPVPRGKLLGGSSSINGQIHVRGQVQDYDGWARLGNRGWGWQDMEPLFKRMENYEKAVDGTRGTQGPLRVTEVADKSPLFDAVFAAAQRYGIRRNPDYNGPEQEGMGMSQATIWHGRRMSTAYCYLRPAMKRPNLRVVTEAAARRLLLDGRRCKGVVFERGGQSVRVSAEREVILCAGSIASPQLLELSGIGKPEILQRYGIEVRHALAGVGEHLRDHIIARAQLRVKVASASYNRRTRGLRGALEVLKYVTASSGFLSLPSGPMTGFAKTRPGLQTPDVQLFFPPFAVKSLEDRKTLPYPAMTASCYQLRPESLGSVHIRSADPNEQPAIRFNFFSHPLDMATTIAGFNLLRRIVAAPEMAAYAGEEFSPGAAIHTDADIEAWIRAHAETGFHPIGTCRMGPGEDAVVDDQLRVHGIQGLRVADASICPTMPSGNTNAAAILVGEKCADLILVPPVIETKIANFPIGSAA